MIKFVYFLLCVSFVNCLYISDGSEKSTKEKIVGGELIDIRSAPYQAQILMEDVQTCGGSIITDYFILTAAHCFEGGLNRHYSVSVGSSYQGSGHRLPIAEIHIHRLYNTHTVDNDIALIKLRIPMKFGNNRQPIPIATKPPKPGDKLKISGFGKIGEELGYSQNLKGAVVTVIDHDECQAKYTDDEITENMFCASKRGVDSCEGDSGGPAVINGQLSGIVSFGIGCASADYPGVYTLIYKYHDWIASKTGLEL